MNKRLERTASYPNITTDGLFAIKYNGYGDYAWMDGAWAEGHAEGYGIILDGIGNVFVRGDIEG